VESWRPADESTARRNQRHAYEKKLQQTKKSFTKQNEELQETLSSALRDLNALAEENRQLKQTLNEYVAQCETVFA
jgi:DNA repair exonuclease SbcCD ATPase subunit